MTNYVIDTAPELRWFTCGLPHGCLVKTENLSQIMAYVTATGN